VTVSDVAASVTRTLGFVPALESGLKGTRASPRKASVYVPGGAFAATVTPIGDSVFPTGVSAVLTSKPVSSTEIAPALRTDARSIPSGSENGFSGDKRRGKAHHPVHRSGGGEHGLQTIGRVMLVLAKSC
jgi:hypothetical protein